MIYDENITIDYLNNIIHSTFEHYYYNSLDSKKDKNNFELFKNDINKSFLEKPPKFETEDDDLNVIYNDIYQDLEFFSGNNNDKINEKKK